MLELCELDSVLLWACEVEAIILIYSSGAQGSGVQEHIQGYTLKPQSLKTQAPMPCSYKNE